MVTNQIRFRITWRKFSSFDYVTSKELNMMEKFFAKDNNYKGLYYAVDRSFGSGSFGDLTYLHSSAIWLSDYPNNAIDVQSIIMVIHRCRCTSTFSLYAISLELTVIWCEWKIKQ